MKRPSLLSIYAILLMFIFAGIVVHAPLSVWLGTVWHEQSQLIKSWKEILMIAATVFAVVLVSRAGLWRELMRDWVLRLAAAYSVLHIVLLAVFPRTETSLLAGLAIDLRYVLFFGLVYVLIRLAPQYRRLIIWIAGVGAVVVVGFATLQLFLPADILSHIGYSKDTIVPYLTVDQNPNYIRVNSTLRGPNPLGAYAGMVLAMVVALSLHRKLNLRNKKVLMVTVAVMLCAVVAVWESYSRSALVAALGGVVVVVASLSLKKTPRRVWLVAGAVVVVLGAGLFAARGSSFVSNVLLHENPNGGSGGGGSNGGHVESLAYGVDRLVHQPLGAGIGSTGSASLLTPHAVILENQYLFIAHETGWLGLALFISLFALIMIRLWRARSDWLSLGLFASGIALSLIGLLLPVWVDDTVSIVWWGLAAVAIATKESYGRRTTNKKAA